MLLINLLKARAGRRGNASTPCSIPELALGQMKGKKNTILLKYCKTKYLHMTQAGTIPTHIASSWVFFTVCYQICGVFSMCMLSPYFKK